MGDCFEGFLSLTCLCSLGGSLSPPTEVEEGGTFPLAGPLSSLKGGFWAGGGGGCLELPFLFPLWGSTAWSLLYVQQVFQDPRTQGSVLVRGSLVQRDPAVHM